jgi:CRP/FNR family transcriptional regulator, cyclic AMP receptor protein
MGASADVGASRRRDRAGVRVDDVMDLLRAAPLFADLDEATLEAVARYGDVATYREGVLLGKEGAPADRFFVLLDGAVALELADPEHTAFRLDVVRAGEVVGWSWLVPPYRWHFDVRTVEPVRAVAIQAEALRVAMIYDDHLASQLLRRFSAVLLDRLQATRRRLLHPAAPAPRATFHGGVAG